ncbi:MAG: glycosyl hydrolase family 95 catalytic domain-containing protein [Planctomycetota bacterium]
MPPCQPAAPSVDRIHDHTPATAWESAMVSGNGTLGAMVHGQPREETIIVNHERLFLPREAPGDPLAVAEHLPALRRILAEDGYAHGLVYLDTRACEKGLAPARGNPAFHPAFSLTIQTETEGAITDYRRETDFSTGEVTVRFRDERTAFTRQLFVSRDAHLIALQLSSADPGTLSCTLAIDHAGAEEHITRKPAAGTDWIGVRAAYRNSASGYDSVVRLAVTDGTARIADGHIRIRGAGTALLLLHVAPWGTAEEREWPGLPDGLFPESPVYEVLLDAHRAIHGDLYRRVAIDLGGTEEERSLVIDALLAQSEQAGALPAALLEKLYNAGRYMSLCCFGELPPNLQGIWTGTWDSPWGGGYVWDTNLQLAMASFMTCNMPELMDAHVNLLKLVLPGWRDNARRIGNCRGLFASGAFSAGIDPDPTERHTYGHWSWMFGAGYAGWQGRLLYDYWEVTGDQAFLQEFVLPYLVEVAAFYEDWLVRDGTGACRFSPACSPEVGFADNPTFEIAVARDVFRMIRQSVRHLSREALDALGIDDARLERWQALCDALPPYLVNDADTMAGPEDRRGYYIDRRNSPLAADGALKEFAFPNQREAYPHRHYSHLYPLFISDEFSPDGTPDLWRAATIAFEQKLAHWPTPDECGTATATHRRMHAALCAARLGRGETIWAVLTQLVTGKAIFPSLMMSHFDNHQVFNVDGNGALPEVVHRMLVRAVPGSVELLPALPAALPRGRIGGLRLAGRLELRNLAWDRDAATVTAVLVSDCDQTVAVSSGQATCNIAFTAGKEEELTFPC